MSYYQHHIFFCTNKRENGEASCGNHEAAEFAVYAKQKCKERGLNGPGKVRITKSGCLDRCEHGPVCVVYPEAVWYTMVDKHDIDEIVSEHVVGGRVVERLRIK
jgi:(2Fe-2S) ferredoxin